MRMINQVVETQSTVIQNVMAVSEKIASYKVDRNLGTVYVIAELSDSNDIVIKIEDFTFSFENLEEITEDLLWNRIDQSR